MTTYDHNGDIVYAEDVLDREELADYYRSQRAKGARRYVRVPRRSDPDTAGDAYERHLDQMGGSA